MLVQQSVRLLATRKTKINFFEATYLFNEVEMGSRVLMHQRCFWINAIALSLKISGLSMLTTWPHCGIINSVDDSWSFTNFEMDGRNM